MNNINTKAQTGAIYKESRGMKATSMGLFESSSSSKINKELQNATIDKLN